MEKKVFKGFSQKTTDFFRGIRENNHKSWFEEHRQVYLEYVLKPAHDLVYDLSSLMLKIDPKISVVPSKIVSRIYRDIRFSKDKSPYKTRLFFSFKRPGTEWMDAPGFYFEVDYNRYSFGMGIYDASPATIKAFRESMDSKPSEFLKATAFYRKEGGIFKLGGERYKRPPAGEKDKKLKEWYAMKNFYLYHESPLNRTLYSPKLAKIMEEEYKKLAPFYKYLWKLKG